MKWIVTMLSVTLMIIATWAAQAEDQAAGPILTNNPNKGVTLLAAGPVQGMPGKEEVLVEITLQPGAKSGDRTHPESRLFYVKASQVTHQINGRPAEILKTAARVFVPAYSTHKLINESNAPRSGTTHLQRRVLVLNPQKGRGGSILRRRSAKGRGFKSGTVHPAKRDEVR